MDLSIPCIATTMHCHDDVKRAEEMRDVALTCGYAVTIAHTITEWDQFIESLEQ